MAATTSAKNCWDTHYKNTTRPGKNAWKTVSSFPYSNVVCGNTRNICTRELLAQNNFEQRVGRGRTLFLLEGIVSWREIEKYMEMFQQLYPGLEMSRSESWTQWVAEDSSKQKLFYPSAHFKCHLWTFQGDVVFQESENASLLVYVSANDEEVERVKVEYNLVNEGSIVDVQVVRHI